MQNNMIMYIDNEFEKKLKKSFHILGELFPITDNDVEEFEKKNDMKNVIIPDSLRNPIEILKRGKIESIKKISNLFPIGLDESINNYKMAARKGSSIPDSILKKMISDRNKAEDESGK